MCGGILAVDWDLELARNTLTVNALKSRPFNMLRYRELLPLLGVDPALPAVTTPLLESPRLAAVLGVRSVAVKVESMQPTGSLKDRASAVAVARAEALGYSDIACASSGNAATAMAGLAAAQNLGAIVLVPRGTPRPKLIQLHAYGARIVIVDGPYETAYQLCQEAAPRFGWYNRNCAQNPYLVEGKKTCGLEIGEQSAASPPDWVAVAVGDGCTIAGIWKGLHESRDLGLTSRAPRLLGVQATAAATVFDTWRGSTPIEDVERGAAVANTLADSIAVTQPHNGARAVDAVRASDGALIAVDDERIAEATLDLPSLSGVFAEPSAAATVAGVRAARETGIVGASERVVVVATGIGFKNLAVVEAAFGEGPSPVPPLLDALEASLTPRVQESFRSGGA